jgi:hypothetical protein
MRPPFAPTTRAIDQISVAVGRKEPPRTVDEMLQVVREAQMHLGERAALGDQAGMADWVDFLERECAAAGTTGLAEKLKQLQLRARQGALVEPLREMDEIMAELDAFLEALATRRERIQPR